MCMFVCICIHTLFLGCEYMFNGIHFEYTNIYTVHTCTCTCIHIFTYIICNVYDVSAYGNAQIYYVDFNRYARTDLILHALAVCSHFSVSRHSV